MNNTSFPIASDGRIIENHIRIAVREIDEINEATGRVKGQDGFVPYPNTPYFRLVQELLLCGTARDGMYAAVEKCRELGLEPHNNAFGAYEDKNDDDVENRTVVFPCKVNDFVVKSGKTRQVIGFECDNANLWKIKLRRIKDKSKDAFEYTKVNVNSFGKTIFLCT